MRRTQHVALVACLCEPGGRGGGYLEVPVVHCAATVRGLRRVLAGVEQPAEFTVEASLGHNELHSCWGQQTQQFITQRRKQELIIESLALRGLKYTWRRM